MIATQIACVPALAVQHLHLPSSLLDHYQLARSSISSGRIWLLVEVRRGGFKCDTSRMDRLFLHVNLV
eukprot:2583625-Amphidinium_carterae.1